MLSQTPINWEKVSRENVNKEILRFSIQAELDAASLYEQFAETTDNENLRSVLLDIAKEEKTHIGEFTEMLLREDNEQLEEMEKGKMETAELTGI